MNYTTSNAYRALCETAELAGHTVKLSRYSSRAWGLELLVAPCAEELDWRATGVLFTNLLELDTHAEHVLRWLLSLESNGEET